MKYKFHEEVPELNTEYWGEEDERTFYREINFLSKFLNIDIRRIKISGDHPCGEDVIFIDSHYAGYLDFEFYTFMDKGLDMYGSFQEIKNNYK